jgi:hypothetical protein
VLPLQVKLKNAHRNSHRGNGYCLCRGGRLVRPAREASVWEDVKARTATRTNSSNALSSPLRASRATPDEAAGLQGSCLFHAHFGRRLILSLPGPFIFAPILG